jgi:hypothetical protein
MNTFEDELQAHVQGSMNRVFKTIPRIANS